jgi:hypothetical protein
MLYLISFTYSFSDNSSELFIITDKPMVQTDVRGQGGEAEGAEGPGDEAAGLQQDTSKYNFSFNFLSCFL